MQMNMQMSQSVAMSVGGGTHHQGFNTNSNANMPPTGPSAIGYQNSPGSANYGSPGNPSAYVNSPSNPTANTPSFCNSPGNQQSFIHSPGFVNSPGQGVPPNYVNSPGQGQPPNQSAGGSSNQGAAGFCASPSTTNNPGTPSSGNPNNNANSNANNDFNLDFLEGDSDLFGGLDSSAAFNLQDIL